MVPLLFQKTFGVILAMDEHITGNKVIGVCYANLRDLGRIGSELSREFKIQLVHFIILPHLDCCNSLFFNMPSYLLQKLTKVLYAAVGYIF